MKFTLASSSLATADTCYEKLDMELAKENWEAIESLDILKKIDKITTLVSSQTGKLKNETEINEKIKELYLLIHQNIKLSSQDIIQEKNDYFAHGIKFSM